MKKKILLWMMAILFIGLLSANTVHASRALVPGDFDGNGVITENDARLFRMYFIDELDDEISADVANANGSQDGVINAADLIWVKHNVDDEAWASHPMESTTTLANSLTNTVQVGYDSAETKANYTIQNEDVAITHNLTGNQKLSSLTSKDGGDYLAGGSMKPYIVRDGITYSESAYDSSQDARANTMVMGYYYDSTYIRDLNWRFEGTEKGSNKYQILWLEKGYHMYSDKVHQTYRLVGGAKADDETTSPYTAVTGLSEFGFEVKIPMSNIHTWELSDGTNVQTEAEATTPTSDLQYIAIDTKSAGVIGFIYAGENRTGSRVAVTDTGTELVIRQSVLQNGDLAIGSDLELGHRLYTDTTHDFVGIRQANLEEQNPFTEEHFEVDTTVDSATFTGYNYRKGFYEFELDGYHFSEAAEVPDKKFLAHITATGGDADRIAYLCVNTDHPLEGATIIDTEEVQLPIPLQVNKNFGHENEEPVYAPEGTDTATRDTHGETYMPLCVEAGKTQAFTIVNVMQNWGNYPLKQLSSIEYFTSYYHLSTGVTETNCIAPFGSAYRGGTLEDPLVQFFELAWFLPDFRGVSGTGQYHSSTGTNDALQHNSVGTAYAPAGTDGKVMHTYLRSDIRSAGLTYADLDYSYISNDGNYRYTMRHVEMPQEDESRTYYTIEFDILQDCTLTNDNFNMIGIGGRGTEDDYRYAAYLGANNTHTEVSANASGTNVYPLNEGSSYFTFYGLTNANQEDGNAAVIVKDYEITQNGAASDVGLAFLRTSKSTTHWKTIDYGALVLNGSQTFQAGDKIKVDLVLLPYGDTVQTDCENVKEVYQDTVLDPITVTTESGTVVADSYIPTVMSDDGVAEFTLSGGSSAASAVTGVNYTVKVQGFTKLQMPVVYEKVNGEWARYDYTSTSGYDGYSVQMEDGTLTYSFVITKASADRTFRVTTNEKFLKKAFAFSGTELSEFSAPEVLEVSRTMNADGTLTLSTSKAEGYIYKKGMNYDAPQSQKIRVKVKLEDVPAGTQIHVGIFGDYLKNGVKSSIEDFSGTFLSYAIPGTADADGYVTMTFDLRKGDTSVEWLKIKGFRLGFNGPAGTNKTITIKEVATVLF